MTDLINRLRKKIYLCIFATYFLFTVSPLIAEDETEKNGKPKDEDIAKPELNNIEKLASEAINAHRDSIHKSDMKIIWPNKKASSPKTLLEQLPENIEIYLIKGYISFSCTRLTWNKGIVKAEQIIMSHTWFYNPKGESFLVQRLPVSAESFAETWLAMQLILETSAEPIKPKTNEQLKDEMETPSRRTLVYSHANHFLIKISENDNQTLLATTRNEEYQGNIRVYEEIRIRALYELTERLAPPHKFKESPQDQAFPLNEWDEFFLNELKTATFDKKTADIPTESRLRIVTALNALGESGYDKAEPLIKMLVEIFSIYSKEQNYYAYTLHYEAHQALEKIVLQNRWSTEQASHVIHETTNSTYYHTDHIKWTRDLFFARNPEAYHELLRQDLESNKSPDLICHTMTELQRRFPGEDKTALWELIQHTDPEVVAKACFLLLTKDNAEDTDIKIYKTLERLVLDPKTPINPYSTWSNPFAKMSALEYLCKYAPVSVRWTTETVRKQIKKPNDGRMVYHLLSRLRIFESPASTKEEIAAYRLSLDLPYSKGTLMACEFLCTQGDQESFDKIRLILNEIQKGCSKDYNIDRSAQYPWTYRSKIKKLLDSLDKIEEPIKNPNEK